MFDTEQSRTNSTERHRMSQEQFAMQNRELDNLTKHNTKLLDQYTRIDIKCSHATEASIAANSRIEQLRNECANLRAEKKIWEVCIKNAAHIYVIESLSSERAKPPRGG
jgi:septal ring factor EnvC (AmiA/AmiB activator)